MEPPVCKLCGKRHWSRLCVTEPVTVTPNVTHPVTPLVTDLAKENEALRHEVAKLKRLLAEGGKVLAMTGAERVAKLRAKRKKE